MAARLTRIALLAVMLGGCSPAPDAAGNDVGATAAVDGTETDRTVLGGKATTLIARERACLVRRDGQPDIPVAPAPPCHFLRAGGQVQQHSYPARGIDAVVMVVGTPADTARKAYFGIDATTQCGTVAHGLIVRGNSVTAARQPQRDGMFCVDQGRDEKDFHAVAHER